MTGLALSILVPSVASRAFTFAREIQVSLYEQWGRLSVLDQKRVEILVLTDTKSINLGVKRNSMVDLSQGEYVAFVDDDDRLAPDYLQSLLAAIEHHPDVITFTVSVSINGGVAKPCYYSLGYKKDFNRDDAYYRLPNHLMAVRREHAEKAKFPAISRGEDSEYARRLRPFLETEHRIPRTLYYYDFDSETTETQR